VITMANNSKSRYHYIKTAIIKNFSLIENDPEAVTPYLLQIWLKNSK